MIALNQFVTIRFDGRHIQTKEFISKAEFDRRMFANAEKKRIQAEAKKDKARIITEEEKELMREPAVDTYKIITDTSAIGTLIGPGNVGDTMELYIPYNGGSNMKVEVLSVGNNMTTEEEEIE